MSRHSLRLPPLPSIGDLLRLYNLRAIKALSQNFLMDSKLSSKIVSCSGKVRGRHVIEVGPGPGSLTRPIIEQGASKVDVIEKDTRFIPTLELIREASTVGLNPLLNIHIGDIKRFDMRPLMQKEFIKEWKEISPDIRIIGNLPFNVSTFLIIKWLREISERSNIWAFGRVPMTLTFQEEVAIRMVARPDHSQRCRLSVMCQNWCNVQHVFTIPGRAFIPKPDVNVAVVHFVPKVRPSIDIDFKTVERVVTSIFSMRQKFCRRGVEILFPEHVRECYLDKIMAVSDVNPEKRPYQLTISEINRLVHAYVAIVNDDPSIKKYHHRQSEKWEDTESLISHKLKDAGLLSSIEQNS